MPTIKVSLSTKGLETLQKRVDKYKDSLPNKVQKFVSKLAQAGIRVARETIVGGEYENYITFKKEVSVDKYGAKAVMIAKGRDKTVKWRDLHDGGNIVSAKVNGLMMEEFGSGSRVQNEFNFDHPDIGKGAWKGNPVHPNEHFPHESVAEVYDEWFYIDVNGNRHETDGYTPSMPMYRAFIEMDEQIGKIAREVFGDKDK